MPMASQTLQVPFTGGLDQGTASEYLDPSTRILAVSNGRYAHDGGVEKRFGVQALTSAVPTNYPQIGTPLACFTRGASLLATDGDGLYAYTPGVSGWTNVGGALNGSVVAQVPQPPGAIPACTATRSPLQAFTASTAAPNAIGIAEGSGVRLVTYQEVGSGGIVAGTSATLYDLATGAVISNNAFGSGANTYNPIPIITGGYAYVFFSDSGHIYYQQLNIASQTFTQGTLVSDAANQVFDATPETNGSGAITGIVIAYNQTGNAGRVRYLRLEALPALTVSASGYTPYRSGGGSGDGAADVIAVRSDYQIGYTIIVWEVNPGGGSPAFDILAAAYTAPSWTQINLGGVSSALSCVVPGYTAGQATSAGMLNVLPLDSNHFLLHAYFGVAGGPYPGQAVYGMTAGAQVQTAQYPYGFMAGRPFLATVGSTTRCYVPFASFEQVQTASSAFQFCTVHLMDTRAFEHAYDGSSSIVQNPRIVASLANRQASEVFYAATMQSSTWRPPLVTSIGNAAAGSYRLPIGVLPSEEWQTSAAAPQPVVLWMAQFNFAPSYSYAEGNGEMYLGGCLPMMYAGQGVNEEGFHMWPSRMVPTQSTGGSLTTTATYGYAFVFSEVDAAGFIHRSAPYYTSVTLTGANNEVIWTVPTIAYTQRQNVVIEVFRTGANLSTYYYVGNVNAYGTTITSTVTYTDGASDTSIASNATIYTTGGALPSLAPPCFRHRIKHLERHYGIDDTGLVVYFSQVFNASDAPYYHDSLTLQFTEETLVALASMDGNLIIGSAQHLWYIQGYGPNALGQNSDAPPEPTLIPPDVGFASPQSLVTFPGGILFQAPSGGIYTLGRDLSVSYIGLGIQDTIGPGVTVVSATLAPRTHDIRLLLSTGAVVSYDYVRGRWATLSYPNSGTLTNAIVDNSQNWTACSSGGNVWQEKPSTAAIPWMDTNAAGSSSWVTTSVTSAHVKLAQLQGYQRLRHLLGYATFLDPCNLSVTIGFDYGRDSQGPQTFTYAQLSAANAVAAQWDMHAKATAGQAMSCQVTMSDAAPTGGTATTGQGCRFLGLAFECQVLASRSQRIAPVVKA